MIGPKGLLRGVPLGKVDESRLYALLFLCAAAAFCLGALPTIATASVAPAFAVVGSATCAWSWLVVRSLFRAPSPTVQWWPLAVVAAMVALGVITRQVDPTLGILRMAANAEQLASSSLLLLAAIEPLRGIDKVAAPERRFRLIFTGAYSAMVAVAVLWVNGAPASGDSDVPGMAIKVVCALIAMIGLGVALRYRAHHPIAAIPAKRAPSRADDADLGERILHVLRQGRFADPDLRVADIASDLGEPAYRVSQCITGTLAFRNFNQLTNAFRLDEAKRRLADPDLRHLPILTIAFDCGFASIGPFNRLFKAEVGMTPKQFRQRSASATAARP